MAYLIGYNPAAPVGQRLSPEVRTEIAMLAPVTLPNGSVTTPKIGDKAVDEDKIKDDTVKEVHIKTGAISAAKLAALAVTKEALANASVDHTKVDAGVPTVKDKDDQPISLKFVPLTATEYASLTPDPDTVYLVKP